MSGFKVGDRVKVVGNQYWEGDGVVTKVPAPSAPLYYMIKMETGRMKGQVGGFPAEELQHRYGPFKPGDRVTYAGNGHIYCDKRKIGRAGEFVGYTDKGKCADVQFDGEKGPWNVYVANLAKETVVATTVPVDPKPGDRVRVTIEGVVSGTPSNDTIRVTPDGARVNYDNVIDVSATGVTVEDIEPEYPQGTVVKDASGVFYQRDGKLWLKFGKVAWTADHSPVRPLTVVS